MYLKFIFYTQDLIKQDKPLKLSTLVPLCKFRTLVSFFTKFQFRNFDKYGSGFYEAFPNFFKMFLYIILKVDINIR